jgi:hypothetical protein
MTARLGIVVSLGMLVAIPGSAQTVVVQDNFDQYANDAAFQAAWVPTVGNGNELAIAGDVNSAILTTDNDLFPGIQGKAVDHIGATASTPGMVNQFGGLDPAFTISPSDTESIYLEADIFVGSSGNERMTVGLRNRAPANLLEMGVYNANTRDPRIDGPATPTPADPNFIPSTGYAYRIVLFGARGEGLLVEPNWQYFELPQELDRATDADELVNIADVGAGWHTYTATVTPTTVTFTLDLFRDGLRNTSITPDEVTGIRPGTAGVDAEATWEMTATAAGFNSLRIGGPSGLSSAGAGAMGFDNILLQLQPPAAGGGDKADFDGDGDIDGADFLTWQRNLGAIDTATLATGDANGDMDVTAADLAVWRMQFGPVGPPVAGAIASVPEPAMLTLFGLAALGAVGVGRRRV